jgi:hypothetical protein
MYGITYYPSEGEGLLDEDGDALAEGDTEAEGDTDADGDTDLELELEPLEDGDTDALEDLDALELGEKVAEGDALGDGEGDGLSDADAKVPVNSARTAPVQSRKNNPLPPASMVSHVRRTDGLLASASSLIPLIAPSQATPWSLENASRTCRCAFLSSLCRRLSRIVLWKEI